jgi:hypothetical protein
MRLRIITCPSIEAGQPSAWFTILQGYGAGKRLEKPPETAV